MKGMDLSAALTSPVQSRGPQQGARQRSEPGNPDAGSFDAVFNDVHSVLPGKTPDADAARDVPADDAVAAPSDAPVSDAAAFAGSAGSTQVAASIEGTQQNVLVAALGLPATGRNETSTPPRLRRPWPQRPDLIPVLRPREHPGPESSRLRRLRRRRQARRHPLPDRHWA